MPDEAQDAAATFARFSENYSDTVQESIGFVGRDLAFFTRAKVYHLRKLGERLSRPLAESSVLDVGCGTGLTDEVLLPYVGSLVGVDVTAEMVDLAADRNPAASYSPYDGQRLPCDDKEFDLVFAINVVHHVAPAKWDDFLSELLRVTASGGLAVVIEHNPLNPLTRKSVRECPFDEDATLVGPRRIRRGFHRAGATRTGHKYILFAPLGGDRVRAVEEAFGWWCPLGAQHVSWAEG